MVSTSYPLDPHDWRGRFIADMAAALGRREDVALASWAPPGALPPGVADALPPGDGEWLANLSQRGGIACLLRQGAMRGGGAAFGLLRRLRRVYRESRADLVHANWLQNALPLWGLATPLVATVLGSDYGLLELPGMAFALRRMLAQRRALLAPNAEWMQPKLEALFGGVAQIRTIPFGIDASWFGAARRPVEAPRRWLVVARVTRAKIGPLFEWGADVFGSSQELHLFGPMQEPMTIPPWVHYHGPAHPAALRDTWFPQASGLVTLSRHDEGRPQVVLEAMAAGLPVIASSLPAHRGIVLDGKTGCFADSRDAFGAALEHLASRENNRLAGQAAREWARSRFGAWDDCAARYVAAYRDVLDSRA
ncbi:MAG TPA: group 1 glycosyl transferase [Betaproteobacteria bacterium]|nr:group 1 glycosyl transferase [Betaproteobacteria bacterium]